MSTSIVPPSSGVVVHVPLSFISKSSKSSEAPMEDTGELSSSSIRSSSSGPQRPILYTTVIDAPPSNLGTSGYCLFGDCQCEFYSGSSGACTRCTHPSAFHTVRPRRADVEAKEALIAKRKQKHFKRAERERREAEAKKLLDSSLQAAQRSMNHFPCEVDECECKRFEPIGAPPSLGKVSVRRDGTFICNEFDENASAYSCDPVRMIVNQPIIPPPEPAKFIDPAWSSILASAVSPGQPISMSAFPPCPDPPPAAFQANYEVHHHSQLVSHEATYHPPVDMKALKGAENQSVEEQTNNLLPSSSNEFVLPRVCKRCKHGEYLHTKTAKDKKKGGRSGGSRPATAATPSSKTKRDGK